MWANGNSVVEKYNNWNGKSTRESHQVWADKKKRISKLEDRVYAIWRQRENQMSKNEQNLSKM